MAIRIAQGAATRVCDLSDRFALQVRAPSDLARAMEALRRARADIVELGVPWTSGVVAAPDGPLLLVDGSDIEYEQLRTIPDLVGRRLAEADVREALVAVPRMGGSLDGLEDLGPAVVLRLFPPAGASEVPPGWIAVAAEWVTSGLEPEDRVKARVLAVEADVRVADVPALLHECALAPALGEVVMGDVGKRLRAAAVVFSRDGYPHVAIAAGGPDLDDDALIARADLLEDLARDLAAEVAYACVDIEPTFRWLAAGPGPGAIEVLSALAGRFVPEAYPFQVLGPGHLEVLGGPPPGATSLPGGRVGLRIDDPAADGAELMGPCLAGPDDVERLRTLMAVEAAPAPGPEGGVDDGARWAALDWLVRVAATRWLAASGRQAAADALATVGPVMDEVGARQATDVLAGAIPAGEEDDDAAWERWERAWEQSGCAAAAEAAVAGIDEHVVASAHERGGGDVWTAAHSAMADVIWRRAWEAAGLGELLDEADREDDDLAAREALAAGAPWAAAAAIARMHERAHDDEWDRALRVSADLLAVAPGLVALAVTTAVAVDAIGAAVRTIARTDPSAIDPVVTDLQTTEMWSSVAP